MVIKIYYVFIITEKYKQFCVPTLKKTFIEKTNLIIILVSSIFFFVGPQKQCV